LHCCCVRAEVTWQINEHNEHKAKITLIIEVEVEARASAEKFPGWGNEKRPKNSKKD